MSTALRKEDIYLTPDEYLCGERVSQTKHEYLAGVVYVFAVEAVNQDGSFDPIFGFGTGLFHMNFDDVAGFSGDNRANQIFMQFDGKNRSEIRERHRHPARNRNRSRILQALRR